MAFGWKVGAVHYFIHCSYQCYTCYTAECEESILAPGPSEDPGKCYLENSQKRVTSLIFLKLKNRGVQSRWLYQIFILVFCMYWLNECESLPISMAFGYKRGAYHHMPHSSCQCYNCSTAHPRIRGQFILYGGHGNCCDKKSSHAPSTRITLLSVVTL